MCVLTKYNRVYIMRYGDDIACKSLTVKQGPNKIPGGPIPHAHPL